jgi:hypothetical protein
MQGGLETWGKLMWGDCNALRQPRPLYDGRRRSEKFVP